MFTKEKGREEKRERQMGEKRRGGGAQRGKEREEQRVNPAKTLREHS